MARLRLVELLMRRQPQTMSNVEKLMYNKQMRIESMSSSRRYNQQRNYAQKYTPRRRSP